MIYYKFIMNKRIRNKDIMSYMNYIAYIYNKI